MKTGNIITATLILLALVCTSPVWADTRKSSDLTLMVTAELIIPCEINIEGKTNIILPTVTDSEVERSAEGALVTDHTQTIKIEIYDGYEECDNIQYALRFTGTPVSGFPHSLANVLTDGASGVAHYVKYIDKNNTFYTDGTFLGDGSDSKAKQLSPGRDSPSVIYLQAGYMRVPGPVTLGPTLSVLSFDVIKN